MKRDERKGSASEHLNRGESRGVSNRGGGRGSASEQGREKGVSI